jgi:hypothetical protein
MENFSILEDYNIEYFKEDNNINNNPEDIFSNEVEIQNFKNQFINLSTNFNSTCVQTEFYGELEQYDDFSTLLKNDDFNNKVCNTYLDSTKFIPSRQFTNKRIKKLKENSNLITNKNNIEMTKKLHTKDNKIFYVYKTHHKKCRHRKRKIKRNKIKSQVLGDFRNILRKRTNLQTYENKFKEIFNKLLSTKNSDNKIISDQNLINKKKITNRKFRLFDKDVIIKKIMSNFLKFIKLIFDYAISKFELPNNFYKLEKNKNFYSIKQCKDYLNSTSMFKLVTKENKQNKKIQELEELNTLLNLKFYTIFEQNFVNSNYFFNYLSERIKMHHKNDEYYENVIKYIGKIISI